MDRPPQTERDDAQSRREEDPGPYSDECEVCGHATYGLHCKIVCDNCGYRRDCSDP